MRALAVIPPMMLDARQRSLRYVNNNGFMEDPMEEYRERRYINVWTAQEKQIFKEKYLQHPKNFGVISSFLEKKVCTVIILSFRTDRSGQTVQTDEQSDQAVHCLRFPVHLLDALR